MKKLLLSAAVSAFLIQPISATYWDDLSKDQQEIAIQWNNIRIGIAANFFEATADNLDHINFKKDGQCPLKASLNGINNRITTLRNMNRQYPLGNADDLGRRLDTLQNSIHGYVNPIIQGYENLQKQPNPAGANTLKDEITNAQKNLNNLFLGLSGMEDVKKSLIPNYLGLKRDPNAPVIDEDHWQTKIHRTIALNKQAFIQLHKEINGAIDAANQKTRNNQSETIMPIGNIVAPTFWEGLQKTIQQMAPGIANYSFDSPRQIANFRDRCVQEKFIELDAESISQSDIPLKGHGYYQHFSVQELHHDESVKRPAKLKTRDVWIYVANVMNYIYQNDKSDGAKQVLQNYFMQLADQGARCYTGGVGRNFLALMNAYDYLLNMQPAMRQPKVAVQPAPKAVAPAVQPIPKAPEANTPKRYVAKPKASSMANKAPQPSIYSNVGAYVPAPLPGAQPKAQPSAQPAPQPNPKNAAQPSALPKPAPVDAEPWIALGISEREFRHNLAQTFSGNPEYNARAKKQDSDFEEAIRASLQIQDNRAPAPQDEGEPWTALGISEREYRHNLTLTFNGNPHQPAQLSEDEQLRIALEESRLADEKRNRRTKAIQPPLDAVPQPRAHQFASPDSLGFVDYYQFMNRSLEIYNKHQSGGFVTNKDFEESIKKMKNYFLAIDERLFYDAADRYRSQSIDQRTFTDTILFNKDLGYEEQKNIRTTILNVLNEKSGSSPHWQEVNAFFTKIYSEPRFRFEGQPVIWGGTLTIPTVQDGSIPQSILQGLRAPHFLLKNMDRILRASELFPQKNFSGAILMLLNGYQAVEKELCKELILTQNYQIDARKNNIKKLEELAYVNVSIEIARILAAR